MAGNLRGSITPIITPFRADGSIDFAAFERLLVRHVEAGGHGVLINGTTAEPSVLTVEERNALVSTAMKTVGGRTQVVAATGSQSLAETRALTEHAVHAGVDALLIVTPYYIKPSQRGIVAYYTELARISDTPLLIYHIPGRAGVSVELGTLEDIKAAAPHFVGMKHAVNDMGFVSACLKRFGFDFRIFVGLEELSFPMLAVGAAGLMNAVGNIAPGTVARLYEAAASGDMAESRALHFKLFELNRAVFFDTNPAPIKYMAHRLGLIEGHHHRLPMVPVDEATRARLDAVMAEAGLTPG